MATKKWFLFLAMGIFLISGCAAVAAGGAAVGTGSITYLYINGELKTDYYSSFEKVWTACEKTVAEMGGVDVASYKEIAKGTISAIINNKKVHFTVKYKAKDVTTVAIRVGMLGDKFSSQLLHDKVMDNLLPER